MRQGSFHVTQYLGLENIRTIEQETFRQEHNQQSNQNPPIISAEPSFRQLPGYESKDYGDDG